MTVLLTILKVIGWILLGILGLILLTVLTVLLVPIRYRADGVWKEEKYIRGRVTWLLHLLSIRVTYEKELLLEVRVAGFLIYLPFLLIDMVTASILMSMGMVMLPPAMISLPFKLLLFIAVDGWELLFSSIVKSFY